MKRALVLAGHGDDSVIALGGTLRSLVEEGVHVAVVCFGNGDEAFGRLEDRPKIIEQFSEQSIAAHEQLGISDFQCLGWTDFGITEDREIYRECIRAIRRVQPDVIFTHDWLEYFQHRAMARMTTDAWWQAGWKCSADLGEPWAARKLYRFEVLHSLAEPTHLVDVSQTFESKLAAIAEFHAAQGFLTELIDQLEARARFHGSKIGVKYAEALTQSFFVPQRISHTKDL